MPVDRESWKQELHLSNFINAYYQYRDVRALPDISKILIIGPGQGLDTVIFRWKNYDVTTLDIDQLFNPDFIGSVNDLSLFGNTSFDVVIASHVLEHLAEPYLDDCIAELARVARYSLIYLPVAGRHGQLRFRFDFKGFEFSWVWDLFNFFHRPNGLTASYCQGQHFWEIGRRGFRVGDLVRRFEQQFKILKHYRNLDWLPSYNFVLESKYNGKK